MRRAVSAAHLLLGLSFTALSMDLPRGYYVGAIPFRNPAGIACTGSGGVYALCQRKAQDGGGLYKLACPLGKRLLAFESPSGLLHYQSKLWVTEPYGGDLFVVELEAMTKQKHVDQFATPGWKDGDDDPYGMAVAPAGFEGDNVAPGEIIIVDRGYSGTNAAWWVHSVDPSTPLRHRTIAAHTSDTFSGSLFEPAAVAAGLDGSVYIAESLMGPEAPAKPAVFKLSASGELTRFCIHPNMKAPQALAVHPTTGKLYISDEHVGHIFEVDPAEGRPKIFARKISGPRKAVAANVSFTSLAWSPDGSTLYAGWGSRVLVFTTDPAALPAAVVAPGVAAEVRAVPFVKPSALAFAPDGALYVARRDTVKAGGGIHEIVDGKPSHRLARISRVADMLFAADGALFISQDYEGHLNRIGTGARTPALAVKGGAGFPGGDPDDDPTGLCIAPPGFAGENVQPGDLIVVDRGAIQGDLGSEVNWVYTVGLDEAHSVKVLRADTDPAKAGPMGDPRGVAATSDGRVFIADPRGDGHIWELKADGTIVELRTVGPDGKPFLIRDAVSIRCRPGTSMLYVVDAYLDQVLQVDSKTGIVVPFAAGFVDFSGDGHCLLAWDKEGKKLCVGDWGAGQVYEFALAP